MEFCILNDQLLQATQRCFIGDLKRLARRIVLESKINGHEKVQEDDIRQGLKDFPSIIAPFQESKSLKQTQLKWEDIGGLTAVKQLLIEIFIWPVKYSLLYQNNSIRLGHGVLLHGPSGCGKTLICKTLADQCNLNVISVKACYSSGPELLSKFVGESEENVRKIFRHSLSNDNSSCFLRARASSPCLIFFDEFDSLGAKRGESNAGVSDRMVNQLLTELDGVEGRSDVYIIAATNRIDLIDNALLRPGRFDYIVECELPNKMERISIIEVLTRSIRLQQDVDVEAIAEMTEGWTGADLKGLITNALLISRKRSNKKFGNENAVFVVNQDDLLFAVKESQPRRTISCCSEFETRRCISPGSFATFA
ncbi:unnamed protein product [Thelazia callipaeda]|uniref:Peroxisomal ATPase PEX1 n=1 Tax=Thelazia callipaeda TaxID=103827 RepID=A0A0N5D468_THECL|nr:unnamed protein product [Thelazia callipaeda]